MSNCLVYQECLAHTVLITRLAFPEQIVDKYLKKFVVQAHASNISATALFDMLQGRVLLVEFH